MANSANLTLVAPVPVESAPTQEELLAVAQELNSGVAVTAEVLHNPKVVEKLSAVIAQRKAEEAERARRELEKLVAAQAAELLRRADAVLNPPTPKPPAPTASSKKERKPKAVKMTPNEVAEAFQKRKAEQDAAIARLRAKNGNVLPEEAYEDASLAMAVRGLLIAEMRKLDGKAANKAALRVAIDVASEAIKTIHGLDPQDPRNHASPDAFRAAKALMSPSAAPPSAPRISREATKEEKVAAEVARLAERDATTIELVEKMCAVKHLRELGLEAVRKIAERVARKFTGTPEERLHRAALEKAGSERVEDRQLGVALARAAGCGEDVINSILAGPAKGKK